MCGFLSIHSNELIYKTKEIKTKKLEDKKEVFLLNQNNSLKWVGLHSRYFLFFTQTIPPSPDVI